MRIHDITVPLSADLPVYPGDSPVTIASWTSIADGDPANVARLTLGSHSGTHVDAPRHFRESGKTVDSLPLEVLVGSAIVVEVPGVQEIGREDLERLSLQGFERVLFKTASSKLWNESEFSDDYVSLTAGGASYLVEAGVKLVGIDYLSVEKFNGDGEVHRILLDNEMVILEGINLEGVAPGEYELICLPLKVKDGDGAPARAILRETSEPGEKARPREHAKAKEPGLFDAHTTKWPLS